MAENEVAPWEDPTVAPSAHSAASGEVAPWEDATVDQQVKQPKSALQSAVSPITDIPSTYQDIVNSSVDQVKRGLGQLVDESGPGDIAKGIGNVALGGLGYVSAPITAPLQTIVGKPTEEAVTKLTGSPRVGSAVGAGAEMAAGFALPVPKGVPREIPTLPERPFGVTLTEGDRLRNPTMQAAEQEAARTGDPHAVAFMQNRAAEIERANQELTQGLEPSGAVLAGTPKEAGEAVSAGVTSARDAAKANVGALYEQAKGMPGTLHAGVFDNMADRITRNLAQADEPVIIDDRLTPYASRMLQDATDFTAPYSSAGMSLNRVDQLRKRMSTFRSNAFASGNAADGRAAQAVLNAFDDQVDTAVNGGAFTGNREAITAWNNARAANADYRSTFGGGGSRDPAGRVVQKILGDNVNDPLTPTKVIDQMVGATGLKPSALNISVAQRIKDILGEKSQQWIGAQQGILNRLITPGEGEAGFGPAKAASRLSQFLNSDIAPVVYSPQQQQTLREYANLMRRLTPPPGTYAPSAPAINRAMSVVGYRVGQVIGALIGRAVTPGVPLIGEFAGITIGGKLERALESSHRAVRAQMPLIGDAMQKWSRAQSALITRPNWATRQAAVGATLATNKALGPLGLDLPKLLQSPVPAAASPDQTQSRQEGGAVDTPAPDDWASYLGPSGVPRLTIHPQTPPPPEAPEPSRGELGPSVGPSSGEGPPPTSAVPSPKAGPSAELGPEGGPTPERRGMIDQLLGFTGPRYQTWPERLVRSAATLPHDVASGEIPYTPGLPAPYLTEDPESGRSSEEAIERAQDIAGMAGGTGFGAAERGALGMAGGKLLQPLKDAGRINPDGTISLYHVTTSDRAPAILEQGLIPGKESAPGQPWKAEHSDQGTYFHGDKDAALANAAQMNEGHPGIASVIEARVPATEKNLRRIIPDEDVSSDPAYGPTALKNGESVVVLGGVPKQYLTQLSSDSGRAGAPLAALEQQHGLYSAVERAVATAPQNKASPEQWLGYLKNQPGVKAEELDWLGLGDDKALPWKGAVTKDQLLAHVQEQKVPLEEVEKGGKNLGDASIGDEAERVHNQWLAQQPELADVGQHNGTSLWVATDQHGNVLSVGNSRAGTRSDARRLVENLRDAGPEALMDSAQVTAEDNLRLLDAQPTRYSDYQLPGGENYRELLLKMPDQSRSNFLTPAEKKLSDIYEAYGHTYDDYPPELQRQVDGLRAQLSDNQRLGQDPANFTSSHWPDDPNVLLHLRMNDRDLPDVGKSLHLEELQSDWLQQGRRRGFAKAASSFAPFTLESDGAYWIVRDSEGNFVHDYSNKDLAQRDVARANAGTLPPMFQEHVTAQQNKVPNAPFKTTWPELGLKRAITKAAQEGKDAISWTPGEEQAKRYDLSQHVDSLSWSPNTERLLAYGRDPRGEPIIDKVIPKEQLADHIGKDAAEKLVNNPTSKQTFDSKADYRLEGNGPWVIRSGTGGFVRDFNIKQEAIKELENLNASKTWHTLQGNDLKVGGTGMRKFYDEMLVNIANKLGKKYGAKVEWKDISPKLQANGLPEGYRVVESPADPNMTTHRSPLQWHVEDPNGKYVTSRSYKSADDSVKEALENITTPGKVPVLRLTPQLKEKALKEGFGMFARGGAVRGEQQAHASTANTNQGGSLAGSAFARGGAVKNQHHQQDVGRKIAQQQHSNQRRQTQNPHAEPYRAAGGRVVAANINHNPSGAQKAKGNYSKDHINIHGLSIAIETAKGKKRKGSGKDGKPWECTMAANYGYLKRAPLGADGDHVDVYLGPHLKSPKVFVLDQMDADTKAFDEIKTLIGFGNKQQALNTYEKCFSDGKAKQRIGHVREMSIDQFKSWLKNGNTAQPVKKGGIVPTKSGKITRAAFLYLPPQPPKDKFAQCSTCLLWTGSTCLIHDKNLKVSGDMTCGLYLHGHPQFNMRGHEKAVVTPEQSGLLKAQVRCENCLYTSGDPEHGCGLYRMLNQRQPEDFDLDPNIEAKGCCNGFTSRSS